MSDTPFFTVFTPTYNRAHTIRRVFDSLSAQTLRDFEWLIVDDGSTDNTSDLVASWARTADFPVRYFKQENSGKHIAHNRGVREARGLIFAPLDSDDELLPDALERIRRIWNAIPDSERPLFSGVGGLCCDQHGAIIGDRFPASPLDSDLREVIYVYRVRGEKWGVTRTDVFRQFPFPEIAGSQFVPEGLIGLQMARAYKRRYVNEVFRVYYVDQPRERGANLSSRANLAKTSPGRLYYYVWLLNHEFEYFRRSPVPFIKAAVMLPIVARLSGQSFQSVLKTLQPPSARALVLLAFPFASLLYASKRIGALLNSRAKM
jgi:glycosyltransferase involved in cell wall biosynthesis